MALITSPNLVDVDTVYQNLIELHAGRSEEDSLRVNSRLILLLINHIGDSQVVLAAIDAAAATNTGKDHPQ